MIDPRLLRDDPDRVRAAQAKRGLSPTRSTRRSPPTSAGAPRSWSSSRCAPSRRASASRSRRPQGEEKQALLARTKTLSGEVKTAEAAQAEAEAAYRDAR